MASVTLTQIQLRQGTSPNGQPLNLYWNVDSSAPISVDPTKIIAVAYAWDPIANTYIPGAIQVFSGNGFFYSSDSYASVVDYMNPVTP
jgi:hypothetical protein